MNPPPELTRFASPGCPPNWMKRNARRHTPWHESWRIACLMLALILIRQVPSALAGDWRQVGIEHWREAKRHEVEGLEGEWTAVIAHPAGEAQALTVDAGDRPPGLYEARIALRPSHVGDAIAFHGGVRVSAGREAATMFPGYLFARAHQPETRTFTFLHARAGPIELRIEAFGDAGLIERVRTQRDLDRGGPSIGADLDLRPGVEAPLVDLDFLFALDPERAVYYLVDDIAVRPISRSGYLVKVTRDKIRYHPGDRLHGTVVVADAGGGGGEGLVHLYLERGVRKRTRIETLPVTLTPEPQTLAFDFVLPDRELGYAIVAEYIGANGGDRHEAAEYFTIAENFNRVYIAGGGGGGGHGGTKADEATMRRWMEATRDGYGNAAEHFAWAEEDMVEMSPETDYWFSGQTNYHIKKAGLRRMIRIAREYGIAQVSYAKFIMSSYLGWNVAYDYPNDHRGQYHFPVGMWEGVNVTALDRFRNKEFLIYENTPGRIGNNPFYVWWADFLPINPDATPRMARMAAEEVVRSVEMFGWDGIRWDGHPRGGGQIGGPGHYDARAARRTQALVRYFKDIVGENYPNFGHGYNYLLIQREPSYDWAYEDFELDELCRGGGLIMNESIGNATSGPFGFIARNLQVEGDLVRERGGFYLGISFASGPRDELVESALWAAAGARPYNTAHTRAMRRYMTRFAEFTLDERLRRLAEPEQVLAPVEETRLWWQPFVYETPLEKGRRQMVVNLLNLPQDAHRNPEGKPTDFQMRPGTDPVAFRLTLPEGIRAAAVNLIDPRTLDVTPVALHDSQFEAPAVGHWLVAIIDLEVVPEAPALADLYGPPRTFGVTRPARAEEPPSSVVLDPQKEIWEVNKDMLALAPSGTRRTADDQTAIDALPPAEREARLLEIRERHPAENFIAGWWRGGALPADLELKETPPVFGDLTPRRNGRLDIFHGRGAMDYRLRLPESFAGINRFQVHDAPLRGVYRGGPRGYALAHAIGASRLPEFDLLIYTGIPHMAIGVEQSYALVEYVKAGGAVLFTGGEYAFGKGGYMHTVLERELLPVRCTETVDTRYRQEPLSFEPGPDWGDLGADLDFSATPSFWVWNQVALRDDPGVKVFLQAGHRPVLVGWQLGQGRVAALLVDHRGQSTETVTAFFDWDAWPELMRALLAWLAPAATTVDPPPTLSAAELAALTANLTHELEDQAMEDLLDGQLTAPAEDWGRELGATDDLGSDGRELTGETLQRRVALLNQALAVTPDPALSAALAEQLATVGNLPPALRWRVIDAVHAALPPNLDGIVQRTLSSTEPAIRQSGYQLAAAAGATAFAAKTRRGPSATETDAIGRRRALVLGLPLYAAADLADIGAARVAEWNAIENERKDAYTGSQGFSLAAPEGPLLDKETLFERVAWLAYLSRYDASAHAAQFAREWLQLGQYQEYCDRSIHNLWSSEQMSAAAKRGRSEDFQRLRAGLERLRELTRPDLERLISDHPERVADGFRRAHFTEEFRAALNFLGDQDHAASAAFARRILDARNPDLAAFAAARATE